MKSNDQNKMDMEWPIPGVARVKRVSTRSPPPIFDSIGGQKTAKEVIRAYKKFGPKRTNRLKLC